ncbi:MAG: hypothetical protein SGPRY_006192, partial [Prymnesium sp.]
MITPALERLAASSFLFERAYAQISVCAPSRNSFITGRRPNSTRSWNFINHFRQADCPTTRRVRLYGKQMGGFINPPLSYGATLTGGYAQCCTSCTANAACAGWSFERGNCSLFSSVSSSSPCHHDPSEANQSCLSGGRGAFERWTPLPALFRSHGYLTLGVGKFYHDGGGGLGGAEGDPSYPAGAGVPPLADRALSWSDVGVQWPNQSEYTEEYGKIGFSYPNFEYLVPDDE